MQHCQGSADLCRHEGRLYWIRGFEKCAWPKKESSPMKMIRKNVPPTLEQVTEYCKERKNNINAVKWWNFYSAKGWMIGKNKMVDWQAAVRTWETEVSKTETPRIENNREAAFKIQCERSKRDYLKPKEAA
jgi:hypothetical protein